MSKLRTTQAPAQTKRIPVMTTTQLVLFPSVSTPQSQMATNKVLKVIQKSIMDLKTSVDKHAVVVDKQLTDLKASVDQGNGNIASLTTKFCDCEECLDLVELRLEKMEGQSTSNYKDIAKQELEASAKAFRIQNVPLEKDEKLLNVILDILAPILQISLQELISEIDHEYRPHMVYTRKAKIPPEIMVKFTRHLTTNQRPRLRI